MVNVTTEGSYQVSQLAEWGAGGALGLAWLAVGLGIAALLSKNTRRGWAIAGLVVGGLLLIGFLALAVLSSIIG